VAQLIFGLLLGWGVAIPLGPMNLEIIRRSLRYGSLYGLALGTGACSADITFLFLLSMGALTILKYQLVLQIVGVLGSLILAYFGYCALTMRSRMRTSVEQEVQETYPLFRHMAEGYVLTFFNPFSILFWSSVSSQIAINAQSGHYAVLYTGMGVLLGTFSWNIGLTTFIHFTRHRISENAMRILNIVGGLMLMGFAIAGLYKVII